MNVERYQFDRIISKTKQMISPIRHGEENEHYFYTLAILEIKLFDLHKRYGLNGRQAQDIIKIILFDIKGSVEDENYDCSKYKGDNYSDCLFEIEQLFMPDKNPKLCRALKKSVVFDDDYYEFPRKHLIRIYESIEQWTKEGGINGYFDFICPYIGTEIVTKKKFLVDEAYLK